MERKRLTSLDALRGIAALSVVLWHWQHFFALSGDWQPGWTRDMQPFYAVLKPFYLQGWAAVDLFFVLSGFVFFWLYGDAVRTRAVGAGRFAWLRFSRLYPLHLATLIAVAAMQFWFFRSHDGSFFVYDDNDVQHFVLSLLFVQNWWPNMPQSFDGPSWSVSIEVMLYVVFVAACRLGLRPGLGTLAVAVAGIALLWVDGHIGRGVIGFFMGGVVFALWERLREAPNARTVARASAIASILGWIGLYVAIYRDWFPSGEGYVPFAVLFGFGLCPLTVLTLALREHLGRSSAWLGALGDISYATYLLQFPLQLALVLVAARFALTPQFFMQGWVMLAFFAALIALAFASYHLFEKPLQSRLRALSIRQLARTG
jgi:peptidoglycan/LPS O-acetylase OafA/YrhL